MRLYSLFIYLLCAFVLISCASANAKQQSNETDSDKTFLKLKEDSRNFSTGAIRSDNVPKTQVQQTQDPTTLYPVSSTNVNVANSDIRPSIMVLPGEASNIAECVEVIKNNSYAKIAMDAINGYLTQHRYNVKALEGKTTLDEITAIQGQIAGQEEDLSYIASLSFGADVYIKYTSRITHSQIIADLRAYESTTGRLLGAQNAIVNDNGTSKEELVRSAMHKAMPGLEKKINAYFVEDARQGIQYKVVIRLEGELSAHKIEDVHSNISRVLKQNFNKAKINVMTDKTIDAIVYVDPAQITDAYDVYELIRQNLLGSFDVRKNSITQKFILMELR